MKSLFRPVAGALLSFAVPVDNAAFAAPPDPVSAGASVQGVPPAGTRIVAHIDDQTTAICISIPPSTTVPDGKIMDSAINIDRLTAQLPTQKPTGLAAASAFLKGPQNGTTTFNMAVNDQAFVVHAMPQSVLGQPAFPPGISSDQIVQLTVTGIKMADGYVPTSINGVSKDNTAFDGSVMPKAQLVGVQSFYRIKLDVLRTVCQSAEANFAAKAAMEPQAQADNGKGILGKLRKGIGQGIEKIERDGAIAKSQMPLTVGGVSYVVKMKEFRALRSEGVAAVTDNLAGLPIIPMIRPDAKSPTNQHHGKLKHS